MTIITNYDNVKRLYLSDRFIHADYMDGTSKIVGMYDTKERAEEVFETLLEFFHYYEAHVFYLPER